MRLLILLMLVIDSKQKCSEPQADDGDQVIKGCIQMKCEAGFWRSSLVSTGCCYGGISYFINATIRSTMSKDRCAEAVIKCVEETPGNPEIVHIVNNNCVGCATKDQLLLKQNETTSKYNVDVKDENLKKDSKALLIGSGTTYGEWWGYRSPYVLSLPDLTPLDCNLTFRGDYWGYVGRYTSDGLHLCGGRTEWSWDNPCYLLTNSGFKEMPGLLHKRFRPGSVMTEKGWWITGGWDQEDYIATTELWSNNEWKEHVRLPHELGVNGHCMARVNQSHIIITGGATRNSTDRILLRSSYMYSEDSGFTKLEDMKTPRTYHGCSVINDTALFVSGGLYEEGNKGIGTEYLDLTTLTWSDGPELPSIKYEDTVMMGTHIIGSKEVFKLEELGLPSDERKWQWVKVGELEKARGSFRSFLINATFCQ